MTSLQINAEIREHYVHSMNMYGWMNHIQSNYSSDLMEIAQMMTEDQSLAHEMVEAALVQLSHKKDFTKTTSILKPWLVIYMKYFCKKYLERTTYSSSKKQSITSKEAKIIPLLNYNYDSIDEATQPLNILKEAKYAISLKRYNRSEFALPNSAA